MTYFRPFSTENSLYLEIKTNACKNSETEVRYLEHVQAVITLNATRRGDIELFLTSPMKTRFVFLSLKNAPLSSMSMDLRANQIFNT